MKQIQVHDSNSGGRSSRNDEIVSNGASAARLDTLPEDCISMVVYHTSPRDACVVASVSKTVKSAAESDLVWEKFLPQDYSSLVVHRSLEFSSKKEMYMSLADDSVLIDDGKKSFWLEKGSGKKCYMLSAMDLKIIWIDTPYYWKWKKDPESKFEKVAKLRSVYWFEIRGKISCGMLSKGTHYSVYAVLKIGRRGSCGLDDTPMEAKVGFVGEEATKTFVLLEPRGPYRRGGYRRCYSSTRGSWMRIPVEEVEEERRETDESVEEPEEREDGWSEVKLGSSYNSDEDCDTGYMFESYTIEFPVEEVRESVEEPKERGDGWSEVKLGNFYINGDGGCHDDGDEIEFSITEIQKGNEKCGLILQGIEIRPMKEGEAVATTSGFK